MLGLTNSGCGNGDADGTRRQGDVDGRDDFDDEPTKPNIRIPPAVGDPPPLTGGKYADRAVGMTDRCKDFDKRNNVLIFDADQREAHRVVAGPNGELVYAQSGKPVHSPGGEAIYVMDEHGNTYVHEKPIVGSVHHSTLAGGEPVVAAGHVAQIGEPDPQPPHSMNNSSGHYGANVKPGSTDVAKNELGNQGVDTSGTRNADQF